MYDYVSDPDNSDNEMVWISKGTKSVETEISEEYILFKSKKDWFGEEIITVIVCDGEFYDSTKFKMTVIPVNDPPFFTDSMPDSISFDSNEKDTLSFEKFISDIDTPISSLYLSYFDSRDIKCSIIDSLKLIILWVESNISCLDTVIFCLSDGYLSEYDSVIITVRRATGINYLIGKIPEIYSLGQNYPNPFNPITHIIYGIPKKARVNIDLYDVNGRFIVNFINEYKEPGYYSVSWDASAHPSGVYFYRIQAGDFTETRKCLLIK